ncbi:MAG TPA: NAD(P)H-dependent oxidoreductase subunit E [Thermomicrobiaceae bacterium]|nr:NAD(P)H-dependent oxidoreductase subunit E [Thermomicrobiaceae bacterium]
MDLHLIPNAEATEEERAALDAFLGPPRTAWEGASERSPFEGHAGRGGHALRAQRHLLLPALQALQARAGYVSAGGLNYLAQRLGVPPAEAWGVASFYALLALEPSPPLVAHVCDDIACRLCGGLELCAALEEALGPEGAPAEGGRVTWHRSPCLGLCERAPAVLVQQAGEQPRELAVAPVDAAGLLDLLGAGLDGVAAASDGRRSVPQSEAPHAHGLRLLRRAGHVDPESLDAYRASGGYEGLRQALALGPEGVIREVTDARLVGRGGAAFPTGRKWNDVARAPGRPHYLICNADESEPGTFKDRVLMEEDPFALVEAMTIAGFAANCEQGFIYIRNEYPLAAERLQHAIDSARRRGLLGDDVMGSGVRFDIEIRRGAGAYICGEETALFNSIEGLRGEPRNKPPYPTQAGLFRKPTLVNNVETLMNVPDIIRFGGPAFAASGTQGSTGTKLFCLCGRVERPGVYEVPFGTTLRQVLELAGGVTEGRPLRAVLLGGAAGSFVTPDELDVPLTFEDTRAIGATVGSGVIMAFDDTVDLTDTLLRIAAFFRDESCGQCVPCRVGTVRQEEALRRLAAGTPLGSAADELALLNDVGLVMRDASICGLGQTAPNAILSAIQKFRLFQNGHAS